MEKILPSFSPEAQSLRPGVYEHYKGNTYKVIQVAFHHETLEELVVYQALYGNQCWFVRPLAMFLEQVEVNGEMKPRFRYVKD